MKEPMTFEQFSARNRQRCESPSGFNHLLGSWSTSDWFTAVLGELGEAANIAKKLNRVRDGIVGNKETAAELSDKLRHELGDTFVYLDLLCQSLGVSIGAAAVEVFNAKSAEIGCPIRMSAGEAQDAALRDPLRGLVEKWRKEAEGSRDYDIETGEVCGGIWDRCAAELDEELNGRSKS